jgi:hypothetical protein
MGHFTMKIYWGKAGFGLYYYVMLLLSDRNLQVINPPTYLTIYFFMEQSLESVISITPSSSSNFE